MERLYKVLLSGLLLFGLLACQKEEEPPKEETVRPPKEFVELVKAHKDSCVFVSAEHKNGGCYLLFEGGKMLTVAESTFKIHDCTESAPAQVSTVGEWWSVDGKVLPVKVDSSLPDLESLPVYVYFDATTLYAHLSNRKVLEFESRPQEDEEEGEPDGGDVPEENPEGGEDTEEELTPEEVDRRQNIPTIHINIGGQKIVDKKNYVNGTITIRDPEKLYSDVTEVTFDMGIRGRGNSTWSFPKKPWKVKLDEKASILGMPADKEWCLLANYADRTLLRNIVAMKLSSLCGFSWTPRMASVEVYLDDEYQGVYTFCEHKKVSADRVNIDLDAGDCYLEIEQQQDETTCWWTGMGVPMMFSDPEEPSADQLEYIKQYFADFEAALYSEDMADPQTGYSAYIDVDSFIDYYIVQELAKNTDGNLRKSSFITKKTGKKMEMYHLWDFDLTFGNNGWVLHDPEGYWVKDYKPDCNKGDNWFNRMFTDPAFVDKVQQRWNGLLPELKKIPAFIDEQAFYLDKAKDRNFEVWSIWESVDWVDCPSLGSYEAEIEFFKEFYSKRLDWMTNDLNKL